MTGTCPDLLAALIELTKTWNDHDLVPQSQKIECRKIGEALHKEGGEELMRDAYYKAKAQNRACVVVQAYWDGIGEWRW